MHCFLWVKSRSSNPAREVTILGSLPTLASYRELSTLVITLFLASFG